MERGQFLCHTDEIRGILQFVSNGKYLILAHVTVELGLSHSSTFDMQYFYRFGQRTPHDVITYVNPLLREKMAVM